MKPLPFLVGAFSCIFNFTSTTVAALPQYTVTKTMEFFPDLGPGPVYFNTIVGVSGGGNNYLATFVDRKDPTDGTDDQDIHYIVDSNTLSPILRAAPPLGYVTGTRGALFSSGPGHMVYSVNVEGDRGEGAIDRIQVARANPDGTVTVLPAAGIEQRGVNASGMVIGEGPDTTSAWLYTDAAGWKNLGSLSPSGYAAAKGINDGGTVVGGTADANDNDIPFTYTQSGGLTAITNGGVPVYGTANAINNNGLVAGVGDGRAFLFNGSTMEFTFITPVGYQKAIDLNSAGVLLGVFPGPPFMGIPGGSVWVATKEDGYDYLESRIAGVSSDPLLREWSINSAIDINDEGWILATGYNYFEHKSYQVLLQPVPEPGTALMCAAAGLAVLQRRRRR